MGRTGHPNGANRMDPGSGGHPALPILALAGGAQLPGVVPTLCPCPRSPGLGSGVPAGRCASSAGGRSSAAAAAACCRGRARGSSPAAPGTGCESPPQRNGAPGDVRGLGFWSRCHRSPWGSRRRRWRGAGGTCRPGAGTAAPARPGAGSWLCTAAASCPGAAAGRLETDSGTEQLSWLGAARPGSLGGLPSPPHLQG